MKPRMSSFQGRPAGVALIITLFFLVLVSIVVIGYIGTVRVDRVASDTHFERMRAQAMASEGVEQVMSTLQREICDPPNDPNVTNYVPLNWIDSPGMLVAADPLSTTRTRLTRKIPLSSGAPTNPNGSVSDVVFLPPDLNTELLVDQNPRTHLLSEQKDSNDNPVKMQVRWVYVRQNIPDPKNSWKGGYTYDTSETPDTTSKTNPIVGRFAYWTDDESAKVNYNLAWTKDVANLNDPGSPTKVDLRALQQRTGGPFTDGMVNALHSLVTTTNYATLNRFFNSPFDARMRVDQPTRDALDYNKFNLTHYNSDPDTTYYGRPRMMLTTQLKNAVIRDSAGNVIMQNGVPLTRPFLDILRNPTNSLAYIDPGLTGTVGSLGNIDPTKLDKVVKDLINNYLKRTDWPVVDGAGHSIQEKYYSSYSGAARDQRLAQVALNIIDYVRSAESQMTVVQPIRAKWLGGAYPNATFTPDFVNSSIQGADDTFKGLTRAPHITEMGMWVSPTPETTGTNKGRYRTVVMVEIYLPLNYGITGLDLGVDPKKSPKWQLYFDEMNKVESDKTPIYFKADGSQAVVEPTIVIPKDPTQSQAFVYEAQTDATKTMGNMSPGEYRIFAMEVWRKYSAIQSPTASLRAAITIAGGPRIDVAPLATPTPTYTINYALDQAAASELDISSYETGDPRVNGLAADWKRSAKNTFRADNNARATSLATPMTVNGKQLLVLQDLDNQGHISAASMRMPSPYVPSDPTTGRVRSAGDLGLIHTGIEGSNTAPQPGIPWRSLHLQPSTLPATTVVPDWAFMDLFTVPVDVTVAASGVASGVFSPHSNSAGGRVNINAKPDPFDTVRMDPLTAVIFGAKKTINATSTISLSDAQLIAKNIYNHTLASTAVLPPRAAPLPNGKLYPASSPVPNAYESPGEICEIAGVADQGEESEQLIRDIGNLITARGNVFTVYTVGQAIKQTPAGKLIVTGEQRQAAMIERYQINKGTTTLDDDSTGLRMVYLRNLTP